MLWFVCRPTCCGGGGGRLCESLGRGLVVELCWLCFGRRCFRGRDCPQRSSQSEARQELISLEMFEVRLPATTTMND